ncbi:MAG: alpha/beta fold hydrolase [Streptosporangiaceae bacterium]|nr:alpha/beta fold hydrolase [Streptosporangiaceae bacterium]
MPPLDNDVEWWVLLHGTPLTPAAWDGVAAHLGRRRHVLCPAATPSGNARDAAAELAARLASTNGGLPERAHLVGHSFGGQVALDLALLAPDRIRTLTLICSRDTPYPAFAAAAAALRRGEPVDPGAVLGRWFTAAELAAAGPVVRYARSCIEHGDCRSWAAALEAIARYDRADRVAAISVPVTLIAAEHDQVSTPAAMSALAGRLPRGSLTVLPGAAHLSPFCDPAALAGLIVRGRVA